MNLRRNMKKIQFNFVFDIISEEFGAKKNFQRLAKE